MKVRDVIAALAAMPQDQECYITSHTTCVDDVGGITDHDCLDAHRIESVDIGPDAEYGASVALYYTSEFVISDPDGELHYYCPMEFHGKYPNWHDANFPLTSPLTSPVGFTEQPSDRITLDRAIGRIRPVGPIGR